MKPRTALFLGIALLLGGCTYAISPELSRQADKSLSFENLQADPQSHAGKTVILGGVIARIKDVRSGTLLEVVQKELDYWGRPRRTDRSGGGFFVLHPGRLDPLVYAPGRELTIAGEVVGAELAPVEAAGAPVVSAKELRLWERMQPGADKPMWMDRLYDPDAPGGKFGY